MQSEIILGKLGAYGTGSHAPQKSVLCVCGHMELDRKKIPHNKEAAAEVVGSNPTLSIFINLVDYSIEWSLFGIIVGQI